MDDKPIDLITMVGARPKVALKAHIIIPYPCQPNERQMLRNDTTRGIKILTKHMSEFSQE